MVDLERIYAEFLESEQEERNKKYEEFKGWIGASSAGHCFKKQYYKLNDVDSDEPNMRVNRLLRLGTIVHSDFEKAIKSYNKSHKTKIETEKQVKIPELKIIGHIDIFEQSNNNLINRVYDLKTVAGYKWRKKFGRVNVDVNPGMYTPAGPNANGQRMVMYTIEGTYTLKMNKAPALAAFSPEPV